MNRCCAADSRGSGRDSFQPPRTPDRNLFFLGDYKKKKDKSVSTPPRPRPPTFSNPLPSDHQPARRWCMVLFSQPSKAWTEDDAAGGLVRHLSTETPSPHQQGQTEKSNSVGGGGGVDIVEEEEKKKRERERERGGSPPWIIAGGPPLPFFFYFLFFSPLSTRLNHLRFFAAMRRF